MSQSKDAQAASSEIAEMDPLEYLEMPDPDGSGVSHEGLIRFYLDHNPTPSDEQIHHLATLVGLPFEKFEECIYQLFGDYVGDEADDQDTDEPDDITDGLLDDEDEEEVDSLDMFLVSFFLRNPEPSDVQIHTLALLVGMTPASLEERIYSLLAEFIDEDEDGEYNGDRDDDD